MFHKRSVQAISVAVLALAAWGARAHGDDAKSGAGAYAKELPDFTLPDPNGRMLSRESLGKDGIVLVVTAPTLSNKDAQEGWAKVLVGAKGAAKAKLVYLQDMQPAIFKDTARSEMRKEYAPEKEPILLLDEDGTLRKRLHVPEEKTVVLVYDRSYRLLHAEEGEPTEAHAKEIWGATEKK